MVADLIGGDKSIGQYSTVVENVVREYTETFDCNGDLKDSVGNRMVEKIAKWGI